MAKKEKYTPNMDTGKPKKNEWNFVIIVFVGIFVISGLAFFLFPLNKNVKVEEITEEAVEYHQLTKEQFNGIINQLFAVDENGNPISVSILIKNELNTRIDDLQKQIDELK